MSKSPASSRRFDLPLRIQVAILLSVFVLTVSLGFLLATAGPRQEWLSRPLMPPNEWGDWLSGTSTAIALIWIVVAFFQGQEALSLQRDEVAQLRQDVSESRGLILRVDTENVIPISRLSIEFAEQGGGVIKVMITTPIRVSAGRVELFHPESVESQCEATITPFVEVPVPDMKDVSVPHADIVVQCDVSRFGGTCPVLAGSTFHLFLVGYINAQESKPLSKYLGTGPIVIGSEAKVGFSFPFEASDPRAKRQFSVVYSSGSVSLSQTGTQYFEKANRDNQES